MMSNASKRLNQNVYKLMLSGYMTKTNETFHEFVRYKVAIKLNVFGVFMKNGVLSNVYGSVIITFDRNWCEIIDGELV